MQKKTRIYNYFLSVTLLLLLVVNLIFIFGYKTSHGDLFVEIEAPLEKIVQPLNKNQEILVHGSRGDVTVRIKDDKVWIISSNCPDQLCVKAGSIKTPGPMIICAPNQVGVRIINRRIRSTISY